MTIERTLLLLLMMMPMLMALAFPWCPYGLLLSSVHEA